MSREIKFRFWNMIVGRMTIKNYTLQEIHDEDVNFNLLIPMQFTGLKDKNGIEIHDGDILKVILYNSEWKTTVRDYLGTLIVDVEGFDWNTTALSFLDEDAEIEIIGNIHENPELL